MKRILSFGLFLLFAAPAWGQNLITRTFQLTTGSKIGGTVQERGTGLSQHIINWTVSGTVSTCSVKVEQSADAITWSDLIAGATCTSVGTSALTTDYANYVRVNATTLTGSGTLTVNYFAFPPGQSLSATVDTTGLALNTTLTNGTTHVIVDSGGGGGSTAQGASTSGVTGSLALTATTTAAPTYTTATVNPPSTDTAGNLRVTNTTALPAGTNGIGKLTANSGVDIGDVNVPTLELAQNSTTSGQVGPIVQCATTTSAPTYTTAKTNPLSCDESGGLRISGTLTGSNDAASATGSAVPAKASYTGINVGGTQRGLTGTNPSGSVYAADVVVNNLTTDSADNAAFTENPVGIGGAYVASPADHTDGDKATFLTDIKGRQLVAGAGTAGTAAGGVMTVQGVASMTPVLMAGTGTAGTAASAVTTIQGIASMTPVQTNPVAATTGGCTPAAYTSAGSTEDEFEIKATAGTLCTLIVTNTAATVAYFRCSNLTAANTTPGTSTEIIDAAIPGSTTGAGFALPTGPFGIAFSTALTCWIVTGEAQSNTTEVGVDDVKVSYSFK